MMSTDVLPIACDVTDREAVNEAVNKALEHFGQIDIVINSAGQAAFGSVAELDPKTLQDVFSVHVFGTLNVIQAALPALKQQKGLIVNVSSFLGYYSLPYLGALGAAKGALNALTTSLRTELKGTGVDVLLFGPPQTDTPFQGGESKRKLASADDVAASLIKAMSRRKREVVKGTFFKIMNLFAPQRLDSLFYNAMVKNKDPRRGPDNQQ